MKTADVLPPPVDPAAAPVQRGPQTDGEWEQARIDGAVQAVRDASGRSLVAVDELLAVPVPVLEPWKKQSLQTQAAAATEGTAGLAAQQSAAKRQAAAVKAEQARADAAATKKIEHLGQVHGRGWVFWQHADAQRLLRIRTAEALDIHDRTAVRDYVLNGLDIRDQWFFGRPAYFDGVLAGILAGMKEAGI
jgi:hypothetical protein